MLQLIPVAVGLVIAPVIVDNFQSLGRLIAIGVFIAILLGSSLFQRSIPPVDILTVSPEEFSRKRSVLAVAMAISVFAAATAFAIAAFWIGKDFFH